jgi:hypothetical protein
VKRFPFVGYTANGTLEALSQLRVGQGSQQRQFLLRPVWTLKALARNSKPEPPLLNRHFRAPDLTGNLIIGHCSEQPILLGSPTGQDRVSFGPA